jgi:transcriptional regulator with XRE-family HTH domain
MAVGESPALLRRLLGSRLKRHREAADLTQEGVSRHFEWHTAKVTRIETGRVAVTVRDVRDLLALYGISDPSEHETLADLARRSGQRTWWSEYRDVMRPGNYVGLEAGAASVRSWEPTILPGLLQTEAYMTALFNAGRPYDSQREIDKRVALRSTRQDHHLTGERPLRLGCIIDESVVHRVIGGPAVMAGQLKHLVAVSQLPQLTVQILPLSVGAHPFLGGPAALLEFSDTNMDVVYLEGLTEDHYERRSTEVAWYREEFDRLRAKAFDPQATTNVLERLAAG